MATFTDLGSLLTMTGVWISGCSSAYFFAFSANVNSGVVGVGGSSVAIVVQAEIPKATAINKMLTFIGIEDSGFSITNSVFSVKTKRLTGAD